MLDPNELLNGDAETCAALLDDLVEEADEDQAKADVFVILGQLDPTELVDGKARWTQSQSNLIVEASDKLEALR